MSKQLKKIAVTGLDQIPFYGDTLEAVISEDGVAYAPLKTLCDAIGVDPRSQREKINGYQWAQKAIITFCDVTGRNHKHYAIRIDDVPAWLMTIKPSKVAFGVREKLAMYQAEAADVLTARRGRFTQASARLQRWPRLLERQMVVEGEAAWLIARLVEKSRITAGRQDAWSLR